MPIIGNGIRVGGASSVDKRIFNSTEDLNTFLESAKAAAGQIIEVLESGNYEVYVLQTVNGVLTPQHIGTDVDFFTLDLELGTDPTDETKNILYLKDKDADIDDAYAQVVLPATGGGSSGGYTVMRLRNALSSTNFTVPYNGTGCECNISYIFTSIDTTDNSATGNGTAYYYVDGVLVLITQNLAQSSAEEPTNIDLGEFLTPNKLNVVKVTVIDADGNRKNLTYNVTVAYNYITSTFPTISVQRNSFSLPITPVGSGAKMIYCQVDNTTPLTMSTRASSSAVYFDIAGLSHGTHTITVYMATTLEGYSEPVVSNTLIFNVVYVSSTTPLLIAKTDNANISQYDNAIVKSVIHVDDVANPNVNIKVEVRKLITIGVKKISNVDYVKMSDVDSLGVTILSENPVTSTQTEGGIEVTYVRKADTNIVTENDKDYIDYAIVYTGTLAIPVDTVDSWSYRTNFAGKYKITYSYTYTDSNSVSQTISDVVYFTTTKLDVVEAVSNGLQFLFDPMNRSNSEPVATRSSYSYTNVGGSTYNVSFSGIDFRSYGWSGNSLRIPLGGSMTIPYQPFLDDVDTVKGKTIEVCFKAKNVYDYEKNIISCFVNNKGIQVTANKGYFHKNANAQLEISFNDETEIRISFVITKRDSTNDHRGQLIYVFVNSDIAGVINYAALDTFAQTPTPANIIIGSEYAELEVYKVRCYDIALFEVEQGGSSRSYQILNNYIADSPEVDDMIARNARNDIFDDSNSVDFNKLPDNCPYLVIECPELPQYKGDKKTVSGYYIDKANPENSFRFEGAEWNVQGTSSQGYVVKNFKGKFKGGIERIIDITVTTIEGVDYISSTEATAKGVTIGENPTTTTVDGTTYISLEDTNITIDADINVLNEEDVAYLSTNKYTIYDNSVPTNAFCFKADVASSEGANNIILMKIWDDMIHWLATEENTLTHQNYDTLTPPQKDVNANIRQCIDGRPIVVYWKDTNTGSIKFWGKYNFNNDKGTPEVFGFDDTRYPHCEAWDFRDNGLVVTEFKSDDFETEIEYTDKTTGQTTIAPRAKIAFEPIFPDDDTYDDYTQLKRVVSWVASTDTEQAQPNTSITPVTYDGVTYNKDNAAYRLAKFKAEFSNYFCKDNAILYYIWTDIFLMVDSRAKNQHMVTFDGSHWYFFPYDGDTALGIDNIGALIFDYWLEDDSLYNGSNVYNGQDSVLWKNVKAVFQTEIFTMLGKLVSKGFGYEYTRQRFADHQAAWSEAIFCADTECKYIKPYFQTGNAKYLDMAQGSKALQREYWLKHRFIYYMAKYMVGDAVKTENEIQLRMTTPQGMSTIYREVDNPSGNPSESNYYEKVNNNYVASLDTEVNSEKTYYLDNQTICVTPFTNTYVIAEFGSTRQHKPCKANESVTFVSTLDSSGDSMLNFYNGSEIKSVGDLSAAYVKRLELGEKVTNLESIIIGSEADGYVNEGYSGQLGLGNAHKLKVVNISNCVNLNDSIDVSKCYNIREVLAKGTKITSVNLPDGSQIRTLKLPDTIETLRLINQINLTTFEMEGYTHLSSFVLQNTPIANATIINILNNASLLSTIKLTDINWTFEAESNVKLNEQQGIVLLNKLAEKVETTGYTVELSGTIHLPKITTGLLEKYNNLWQSGGLTIVADITIQQFPVTFKNWNGTLLGTVYVDEAEMLTDYIEIDQNGDYYALDEDGERIGKLFSQPSRAHTWSTTYTFTGWSSSLSARIREATDYTAQYTSATREYTIVFKNGATTLQTIATAQAGSNISYTTSNGQPANYTEGSTPYMFKGWTDSGHSVYTGSENVYGYTSSITLNASFLSGLITEQTNIFKPTITLNAIFDACELPDIILDGSVILNPEPTHITQYLSGFDYAYTNDPNRTSAYTLNQLYAIAISNQFDLYLRIGDRLKFVCDNHKYIGGNIAAGSNDNAKDAFEAEVMGFNVYEREDSGFVGIGNLSEMGSGTYMGEQILGNFTSIATASTELSGATAGLYVCVGDATNANNGIFGDGNIYYWNGTSLNTTPVTQYFSHIVFCWRFADSDGTKGQYMDTTYQMNTSGDTTNGWGDDSASTNKKCKMNQWLNDGYGSDPSVISTLPSGLQAIITPVKVLSRKGKNGDVFSTDPVVSVSKLFLLSNAEAFGTTDTGYLTEINKWATLCTRDSGDNLTRIAQYARLTSNNIRIKRPSYGTGSNNYWWLRSAYTATFFCFVYGNGAFDDYYAGNSFGVSPSFCIG